MTSHLLQSNKRKRTRSEASYNILADKCFTSICRIKQLKQRQNVHLKWTNFTCHCLQGSYPECSSLLYGTSERFSLHPGVPTWSPFEFCALKVYFCPLESVWLLTVWKWRPMSALTSLSDIYEYTSILQCLTSHVVKSAMMNGDPSDSTALWYYRCPAYTWTISIFVFMSYILFYSI